LAAQVGGGPLLDRAADVLHALVAGRLAQKPDRQADPVGDRYARADEGEENRVVVEELDRDASLGKVSAETPRRGGVLSQRREQTGFLLRCCGERGCPR